MPSNETCAVDAYRGTRADVFAEFVARHVDQCFGPATEARNERPVHSSLRMRPRIIGGLKGWLGLGARTVHSQSRQAAEPAHKESRRLMTGLVRESLPRVTLGCAGAVRVVIVCG